MASRPLTAFDRMPDVGDTVRRLYFDNVQGKILTMRGGTVPPGGTLGDVWIRLEGDIPGHEVAITQDTARFWVYLAREDGGSVVVER
jgi:hypothetical protein